MKTAKAFWQRLLRTVRALLFPRVCAACGQMTNAEAREAALCPVCLAAFEAARNTACPGCGKTISMCRCRMLDESRAPLYSLLPYRPHSSKDVVSRMLLSRKERQDAELEEFLAEQMKSLCIRAIDVHSDGCGRDAWVIAYPPRGRRKRREVGHDQSEVLAKRIAARMNLELCPCLVRRHGANTAQKTLGADARADNARESYRLSDKYAEAVRGKRVLLIDDIATTGATLDVCAVLLLGAGAVCVTAVTAARTVRAQSGSS